MPRTRLKRRFRFNYGISKTISEMFNPNNQKNNNKATIIKIIAVFGVLILVISLSIIFLSKLFHFEKIPQNSTPVNQPSVVSVPTDLNSNAVTSPVTSAVTSAVSSVSNTAVNTLTTPSATTTTPPITTVITPPETQKPATTTKELDIINESLPPSEHNSVEIPGYISGTPLNFDRQLGMWFPYSEYSKMLSGKTETEFRNGVAERFQNTADMGCNTVFVHARAFQDAYYESELFPKAYSQGFDPLEIMVEEAHKIGLSFHAWINPLRGMTESEMSEISDKYQIKKWYNDPLKNGYYTVVVGGRVYLNPAYSEVRTFIVQGVEEILNNYEVDGIHIDDYFYPTSDWNFDRPAFEEIIMSEMGQSEIGDTPSNIDDWRRENINKLVKEMYTKIKSKNSQLIFGISPQGNISENYSGQYADVEKWLKGGYCDWLIPQLYYGFKNESSPFTETLEEWVALERSADVKLSIGICTYKVGENDIYAGSGAGEWIENPDIPQQQVDLINSQFSDSVSGIAVYSYAYSVGKIAL